MRDQLKTFATVAILITSFSAAAEPDSKLWRTLETDKDCVTTRNAVLAQTSIVKPELSNCVVTTGRWVDAWTGRALQRPGDTDVEHVVPVQKALDAGGAKWDTATRQRFFNDLDNLVVVSRQGGVRPAGYGPDMWLPTDERGRCFFARTWISVKKKWRLVVTDAENRVLSQVVSECPVERGNRALNPFAPISVDELF